MSPLSLRERDGVRGSAVGAPFMGGIFKHSSLLSMAAVMALLLAPSFAHAHELNPLYCGSGPYSLLVVFSCAGMAVLPGLLLVHMCILHVLVALERSVGELISRTVAIFALSKLVECGFGLMFLGAAWGQSSPGEIVLVSVFLFLVGFVANTALTAAFFRSDGARLARVLGAAFTMSATSFAVLFVANNLLLSGN